MKFLEFKIGESNSKILVNTNNIKTVIKSFKDDKLTVVEVGDNDNSFTVNHTYEEVSSLIHRVLTNSNLGVFKIE